MTEASDTLQNPALIDAAESYRLAAESWRKLAENALPDSIAPFAETKKLMQVRYSAFCRNDTAGVQKAMSRLAELESKLNGAGFPLDETATDGLFEQIGERINDVYQAEVNALNTLKSIPV